MFRKLLSNLPFNPSLIGQVSFYTKRMHREESLRKVGLVFVVLALVVQMFAVVSPPEPTLAESNNDIVRGGFSSREQAVNYCRTNTQDFGKILGYFKISCDALAGASTVSIKSTDHSKQLHSMGRVAQGPVIARTGKPTNEYPVMINGTQYFMRNLWAWDSGAHSTYKVLQVKNSDGATIKVLFNCGNIVTVGKYTPPPPPKPPQPPKPPKPPEPPKDVCPNVAGVQTKEEDCDVCPNVPGIQKNPDECYPCPEAEENDATTACLELSKKATNQTQNIPDANNTRAQASDVIIYTLSIKNKGTQAVKGFIVDEDLTDVLEYADVVDLNGGQMDATSKVVWPKEDIAAGATLQKTITVRVKNPVPQTPASASDPNSFDLVMNNVFYGDAVNIELPAGITKSTEVLVETLPSTGPGSTLLIGFLVTVFVSYFFARSRLMAKELEIVRADFTSTGGM
jgi:uncharacterized repeat protein (TIGR01451 family)